MFEATKLHEESLDDKKRRYTFRIGKKVPQNAVNLAYYFNKKVNSEDNVLVSEAPKNTIDHITVSKYLEKLGEPKIDDSIFPPSLPYHDDNGYEGRMKLEWIKWNENVHEDKKDIVLPITQEVTEPSMPETYPYDKDGYTGMLELEHVDYTKKNTKTVYDPVEEVKDVQRKMYKDNLPTPYYNWPSKYSDAAGNPIEVNDNGFKGYLNKVADGASYTLVSSKTAGMTVTRVKEANSLAELPTSFTETINGQVVTFTRQDYEVIGYEKKVYGTHAWLGNFGDNNVSIYGDPIYDYDGSGPLGGEWQSGTAAWNSELGMNLRCYGNFSDPYPKAHFDIYNARGERQYNSNAGSSKQMRQHDITPTSGGTWAVDFNGEVWSLDTEESAKYGSPSGEVWADVFWDRNGGKLPENSEPLGTMNSTAVTVGAPPTVWTGTGGAASHGSVISVGDFGAHGRGQAYYVGDAMYSDDKPDNIENYWYRNVIIFYKVVKPGVKGFYTATVDDGSKDVWKGEQLYSGQLKKTVQVPREVILSWIANATYAGVVKKVWYDYDGLAYYEGIATKRTAIGNINPEGYNEILMYPDDTGVLYDEYHEKEIESELFYITNMFKDNVPLYYMYRLKYPVFDHQGPDEYGMYQGNAIKLMTANLKPLSKKYKYAIKLEPLDQSKPENKNLYYVYIYTSFVTTNTRVIKCVYNAYDVTASKTLKVVPNVVEPISVQPFLEVVRDYKVIPTNINLRRNYIQLVNNPIVTDSRRKIPFSYVVKTTDGAYTSNTISASAINIDYALSIEKSDFVGRNYVVSPKVNGRALTAYEIIVAHCSVTSDADLKALKNKVFKVEIAGDVTSQANRTKVNLFTNSDGTGPISVETTEDTGFFNSASGKYDKMITLPGQYKLKDGKIYPAYKVMCRDVRAIKTLPPRETDLLDNWYMRVQFGHFSQVLELHGVRARLTYTIPEYNRQIYSATYGRPYVEVAQEKVTILNEYTVKTRLFPLYVKVNKYFQPTNLRIYKIGADGSKKDLTIARWSFTEGIVVLEDVISENDNIVADYVYEEQSYIYRGFYDHEKDFIDIEFNPNQYHTYLDNTFNPPQRRNVYDLFNKIVYFFLRPSVIEEMLNDKNMVQRNSINSFPDTVEYSDAEGFSGTLHRDGDAYVESGVYISADTKTVTEYSDTYNSESSVPSIYNYNKDLYVGVLPRVSIQKSIVGYEQKTIELDVRVIPKACSISIYQKWDGNNWVPIPNDPRSQPVYIQAYYDALNNGYVDKSKAGNQDSFTQYDPPGSPFLNQEYLAYYADYRATMILYDDVDDLTKPIYGNFKGVYTGKVNRPESDSRVWRQEYRGSVTRMISSNADTLYHQIDNPEPESTNDLMIGSIYVRHNTSLKATTVIDTRTRGGGILEEINDYLRKELEPESDYYWDIGYWDGEPYTENAVVVIRLDQRILQENGGRFSREEVEEKVNKWIAAGVMPIIEYVVTYDKDELPQASLEVEQEYTNTFDYTPNAYLAVVDI